MPDAPAADNLVGNDPQERRKMKTPRTSRQASRASFRPPLVVIAVILVGWALHVTAAFMVPVAFSFLLALLVAPLDRRVAERMPPRFTWVGHVAAMGAILVFLLVLVGMIWMAAQQLVERFPSPGAGGSLLPQFGQEFRSILGNSPADASATAMSASAAQEPGRSSAGSHPQDLQDLYDRIVQILSKGAAVEELGSWASGIATKILGAASATLVATLLVIFLTLIMLVEAPEWRRKIDSVLHASTRNAAVDAIAVISALLRRYLIARTILGVITAALYVGWLWFLGVDLLVVWGLLAFALNYVPTLGSIIAGVPPILYAVVQKDPGTAVVVAAGILVIEQVMGNYVDPRVQGRQVSLSSLVVLISLLLWGWIWGIAGAILAVPLTITVMVVCLHVEHLRPLALMLSNLGDLEELDQQVTHPD